MALLEQQYGCSRICVCAQYKTGPHHLSLATTKHLEVQTWERVLWSTACLFVWAECG